MLYLIIATAVAMVTVPTSFAIGSALAYGKIHDMETAYLHVTFGVRQFILTRKPVNAELLKLTPSELKQLAELVDEGDDIAGYEVCRKRCWIYPNA